MTHPYPFEASLPESGPDSPTGNDVAGHRFLEQRGYPASDRAEDEAVDEGIKSIGLVHRPHRVRFGLCHQRKILWILPQVELVLCLQCVSGEVPR